MSDFIQPVFLAGTNIYEVNLRQYTPEGTIQAFCKHLPRLKDMGVEILWIMPVHPIGKINRKGSLGSYYSIRDFEDINPEFGDKNDFRYLVEKTHELGMRIIMDWVANHASWDNVWTKEHPDFFERDEHGNFKPPYDWDDVIQINHQNPQQQLAMIRAMKYWVSEFDIDGFRADLAHLTPLPFWINARRELSLVKNDLIWLAETEEIAYHQAFDISFAWEWMHVTEDFSKGQKNLDTLLHTLHRYRTEFPAEALRMFFTSNHDENSWNGTEVEKYNDFAPLFAVFSATWIGVPLIYSGQELPIHHRLKFFDKDYIPWEEGVTNHAFYKALLQLRKINPVFAAHEISYPDIFQHSVANNVLAFTRKAGESSLVVILNFNRNPVSFSFNADSFAGLYTNIFTGNDIRLEGNTEIQLESVGYFVGTSTAGAS